MISLIVPVYNGERHLPGLLAQLRAQAALGAPFEAVFVDDGSVDGSRALLEAARAASSFPLRVLSQENRGVSAARNAGLAAARGEWAAFADVDDCLAPDALPLLASQAEKGGFDALFFAVRRLPAGGTIPPAGELAAVPAVPDGLLREFLIDPKHFGPYSMLLRRGFLEERGLRFAEGRPYYEDYDFLARVMLAARGALRSPAALYGYRMAEGSAMARFSAQRVACLDLARATAAAVGAGGLPAGKDFARWFEARLYWSVLWQACLALPAPRDIRAFLGATDGRVLLRRLAGFPDRKVAATAALARLCPEAFALLARRLGGSHSLLARMTPAEAAALLAEVRALPR